MRFYFGWVCEKWRFLFVGLSGYIQRDLYFHFLSNWMGYGSSDRFPFDLNQMEFHLFQNRKETSHYDYILFNVNGNVVFSVYSASCWIDQIWIIIAIVRLIWHQSQYCMGPNQLTSVITIQIRFNLMGLRNLFLCLAFGNLCSCSSSCEKKCFLGIIFLFIRERCFLFS